VNTKLLLAALLGASLIFSSCLSANEGLPHAFEAGWKGEKTCELMFEDASVRVGRCIFPPGVGHEKHYHNPHFGYVLEGGTLRITDKTGTRTVNTKTDGTWKTDSITVHEAVNIGDTTTSYIIVEPRPDKETP